MCKTTINKEHVLETLHVMFQLHIPRELPHNGRTMKTIYDMAEKHSKELLYEVTDIYCEWYTKYK